MADLKISQLPALGDNLATADKIAVVDGSASETKSLTIANLFSANSFNLLGSNAIPIAKISVTAGSIAGTAIADLGISTAKVANDAITAAKLDNNSSAQIVTSLPGSGGFTGQIAANSNDGYAASIWDGSAWQSIKAAASINTINGDTSSIVNIAVATSGSTRTISASIDDSSAAAQFMAGPSGAAGSVSLRAITGADLPTATSSALGAIKVNGEGLRMDTGVIEIDNDVSASSAYNLVTVTAKGLVSAYRTITAADLPAGTTSAKGALQVGTGLAVSSGVISVDNTATAGTYTKVTITASGLVSSGTTLTDADLPNHSAALLTSGTLAAARIGTDSVDGTKLSNSSTTIFQSIAQQGYPTAQFNGQLLFDTVSEDAFIWDGNAWQAITTLTKGSLVFGGNFNCSTSKMTACTSAGLAAGLAVGSNLPTPSETTDGVYVVVDTAGTPSAPAPVVAFSPPDYILGVTNSSGSSWNEIDLSQTVAGQVASNITFTPYGQISSTNVQDAMQELETEKLAKSGGTVTGEILIGNAGSLVFEGATADAFETTIGVVDPTTADKTINFPDQSGTVLVSGGASILNADVATNCALAYSKLAALANGSILIGSASNVATVQALSGDATLSNAGVLTIAASAITNSKISSSAAIALSKLATGSLPTAITISNSNVASDAAIAGSKISPDFGTQAITTSGNLTLSAQADLRLGDAAGGEYVAIQSGATVGTSYTIELPTSVGATGKVLKSTVSGTVATLTWEDDATNVAAASLTGSTLASGVTASSLTSVGTLTGLTVSGDVSIADKIVHTGDTDTAIRFSSDDTISIETAGVTRATVTGNNIDLPDAGTLRFGASNDLQIYHGTGGASNIVHSNTAQPLIINASGAGTIRLDTDSTERARIDSSGNVLIGTTTAQSGSDANSKLQLFTSSGAKLLIGREDSSISSGNFLGMIDFHGTDGTSSQRCARVGAVASGDHATDDKPTDLVFQTCADGAGTSVERLRLDSSGRLLLGTTTEGEATANDFTLANSSNCGITIRSGSSNNGSIYFSDGTSGTAEYEGMVEYNNVTNALKLYSNHSLALTLDSSQNATFAGTVSDSKGELRTIPQLSKSSAHTIVASDAGKHSINSSGGWVIDTSTGFTAGQAITLINNSSGDQTITSTGVTLYNSADGSTPTKIATRGMATVICTASNTYYISGAGLS